MSSDIVHIVGDCFGSFCDDKRVFTVTGVLMAIEDGTAILGRRLVAGQAITAGDWARVRAAVVSSGEDLIVDESRPTSPAWLGTHKQHVHNVLVSDLRPVGSGYVAALHIHPANIMLADRDTGARHLPGMLEVEACLQMAMATTARYLTPATPSAAFVTSATDIRFRTFLFPLPASLSLTVETRWERDDGRVDLDLSTQIIQGGTVVMSMDFTAMTLPAVGLTAVENAQIDALSAAIASATIERKHP
ncbi:AfsA-related hotdog domain-containing protein [Stackebrandtia soli]|uniref:AfsA-related hotdog domain-containing protein n=1 Tax=Stackebrandtia soli TaxID=1892856 RepID=UPI0039E7C0B4